MQVLSANCTLSIKSKTVDVFERMCLLHLMCNFHFMAVNVKG